MALHWFHWEERKAGKTQITETERKQKGIVKKADIFYLTSSQAVLLKLAEQFPAALSSYNNTFYLYILFSDIQRWLNIRRFKHKYRKNIWY